MLIYCYLQLSQPPLFVFLLFVKRLYDLTVVVYLSNIIRITKYSIKIRLLYDLIVVRFLSDLIRITKRYDKDSIIFYLIFSNNI